MRLYDGPDQVPHARSETDALVDELGEAINVLATGRQIAVDDRVRLVEALLDIGERAGLREGVSG